jgi:hypothetical protein
MADHSKRRKTSSHMESSMLSASASIFSHSSSSSGRYFLGTEWNAIDGRISPSLRFSTMVARMLSRNSGEF